MNTECSKNVDYTDYTNYMDKIRDGVIKGTEAGIQIDSFNDFIHLGLKNVIEDDSILEVTISKTQKYTIIFEDITVDYPYIIEEDRTVRYLTPSEARLRDLNYDAPVCVNIRTIFEDESTGERVVETHNKIPIARIPIMLKSCRCNIGNNTEEENIKAGECRYDPGGYFVIRGKERVIIAQERINYNVVYTFPQKSSSKYKYVSEIRSMAEGSGHSVLIQARLLNCNIYFSLPYIQSDIPAGIIFKALGFMEEDFGMLIGGGEYKGMKKYITGIERGSHIVSTRQEALDYIGKFAMHIISKDKRDAYTDQILTNELLPHLGITASYKEKALFLGYINMSLILLLDYYEK